MSTGCPIEHQDMCSLGSVGRPVPGEKSSGSQPLAQPRIAIAHDYITQRGGAERVLLAMLHAFPNARLITSVYDSQNTYPAFAAYEIETSPLQRVSAFRRDPRKALPLLAATFGRMRIKDVDIVLCSSSGWAHGVNTVAPKLVYCYNPARWIYQKKDYIVAQPAPVRAAFSVLRPYLRRWDRRAAAAASGYLTSSTTVQARILSTYGITASILPPPVSIDAQGPQEATLDIEPGYFLVVGRARGYKNIEATCEAFARMLNHRLVVVGGLPARPGGGAWPSNLRGLERIPDSELRWLYAHCYAVLATSYEDFGLTPLEANAFGRPAIVLRAGGFLDTLVEGVTGFYISDLDVESIIGTVLSALASNLDSRPILEHADKYSLENFTSELRRKVDSMISTEDDARSLGTNERRK